MSVNKVILVGRLGQNPEVKYTPSGQAVANFSVATNEVWMDKQNQKQERTEWHRVVVWGKQAEHCGQYLSKGRQIYIEGKLQTRQWQDKEGQTKYTTEVQALNVQFLGAGANAGTGASAGGPGMGTGAVSPSFSPTQQQAPLASANQGPAGMDTGSGGFTEEDIPF